MRDVFTHLNNSDASLGEVAEMESAAETARRRILGRLGEYVAHIVAPLNMRTTAATLLAEDGERVEVRVSTADRHVVLVMAPDWDLAAEVFFLRSLAIKSLPAPRLIAHDLSCAKVPFTYAIEAYIGGVRLNRLEDAVLQRVAARQIGRSLRRIHQISAPAFGRPSTSGRWPDRSWTDVLESWLVRRAFRSRATEVLGPELLMRLLAATLEHPALSCSQPMLLHGAVAPDRALVTSGDRAQLEAIIRPGMIVAGDPLFDLAHGLLPCHPAAFRQGLQEGYTAGSMLEPAQQQRLRRLQLLLTAADLLWRGASPDQSDLPSMVAAELEALADA